MVDGQAEAGSDGRPGRYVGFHVPQPGGATDITEDRDGRPTDCPHPTPPLRSPSTTTGEFAGR